MATGYYLLDRTNRVLQYTYPRRGGFKPSGTIIVHTAENAMDLSGPDDSAENVAANIANRSDYGSYHRLVDADSIVKLAPFWYETWQDSETNNWAIGISAAVQAARWLDIESARRDRIYRNLARAAAEAVTWLKGEGIDVPIKRITGAQARARQPGFCAHGDSGIARSDPGRDFDWNLFFYYVRQELGTATVTAAAPAAPLDPFDELMEQIMTWYKTKAEFEEALRTLPWTYQGQKPGGKKGEKDPRDAYSYLRNMPYLVWAWKLASRAAGSAGKTYQAASYLVVTNANSHANKTTLGKVVTALAGIASNTKATANELRQQLRAAFNGLDFDVTATLKETDADAGTDQAK
jgi:hypothetical protein